MSIYEHRKTWIALLLLFPCLTAPAASGAAAPVGKQIHRIVELDIGESRTEELSNGKRATVKLLDLEETRDELRDAVRSARVKVAVDGQELWLTCAGYTLPTTVGRVQIDCPITKGYYTNTGKDAWGLGSKTARIRLWPAGSPLLEPGTFVYPVKQRWFASGTQMGNEPVYVDGPENWKGKSIYYHSGLDLAGAEGKVEVVAASAGQVVAINDLALPEHKAGPVTFGGGTIWIVDDRGWYHWYTHLKTIDVKLGDKVAMGQRLGLMGKEGGSGGCSHLHFEIKRRQPSGLWGTEDGYAILWEAYVRQYAPPLLAVARPHHMTTPGRPILLDGNRSRSIGGTITRYEWTFTDGSKAEGPTAKRTYDRPGRYSEVLKVTDNRGNVDHDFTVVDVMERTRAKPTPAINPNYFPTFGIKPGDPIAFSVRSFHVSPEGDETWSFGDGSPPVTVHSDGSLDVHAQPGYATTVHRYARPGLYLVRVERPSQQGEYKAVAHLQVRVGERPAPARR